MYVLSLKIEKVTFDFQVRYRSDDLEEIRGCSKNILIFLKKIWQIELNPFNFASHKKQI